MTLEIKYSSCMTTFFVRDKGYALTCKEAQGFTTALATDNTAQNSIQRATLARTTLNSLGGIVLGINSRVDTLTPKQFIKVLKCATNNATNSMWEKCMKKV